MCDRRSLKILELGSSRLYASQECPQQISSLIEPIGASLIRVQGTVRALLPGKQTNRTHPFNGISSDFPVRFVKSVNGGNRLHVPKYASQQSDVRAFCQFVMFRAVLSPDITAFAYRCFPAPLIDALPRVDVCSFRDCSVGLFCLESGVKQVSEIASSGRKAHGPASLKIRTGAVERFGSRGSRGFESHRYWRYYLDRHYIHQIRLKPHRRNGRARRVVHSLITSHNGSNLSYDSFAVHGNLCR